MQNIGLYYWNVAVWEKRWGQFSVCGCVCVQKELKRRIAKRYVSSELQSKRREKETNIKKNIINTHTELAWRLYLRSAVLWFLNWSDWAAGEGGGLGRKGRWKREKERDEGKVAVLYEHLIIIYIRSVSPSPQERTDTAERSWERDTQMLIHISKNK